MEVDQKVLTKLFLLRDEYVKELVGFYPFGFQKKLSNRLIESVVFNKGETIVGEFSRQSGKTTIITATVCFLIQYFFSLSKHFGVPTTPFFNVGFFAPQYEQARTDFFKLRGYLREQEKRGIKFNFEEFSGNTINIKQAKYPPRMVYCFTASPTSHPESKTLNLIIFEESQDLDDVQVNKAISPMGASTNATEVYIGVGGYRRCRFWELIDGLPEDQKFIIPYEEVLEEHRLLYAKTQNPFYLNYKRHILKRKREIGETSDEFKTQYLLKWILERGQFITYDNLLKLQDEYLIEKTYSRHMKLYGGIDWGKVADSTVFSVVNQDCQIIAWHEFLGDDYDSQGEEIAELIKTKYQGMSKCFCDSTGNQDMGVDMLKAKIRKRVLGTNVIGVNFTAKSKDEMYKNLSRLMHDTIVDKKIIKPSLLRFPAGDMEGKEKFVKQFIDLQKEVRNNMWRCNHPEGPNYHDDYCDSLALACLGFRRNMSQRHTVSSY